MLNRYTTGPHVLTKASDYRRLSLRNDASSTAIPGCGAPRYSHYRTVRWRGDSNLTSGGGRTTASALPDEDQDCAVDSLLHHAGRF